MGGIGTVLTLLSGVAWTVVYVEAIRIGFTQRTYAVPAAALTLNIAWEWLYAFLDLTSTPGVQGYVNLVWALADVAIVFTFFRFGFAEFSDRMGRRAFVIGGVGLLAVAVVVQLLFLGEFGRSNGEVYSAFLQNLLMSGLFIAMFLARHGGRGQSLAIAVAKWLGTLAPTVQFGLVSGRGFVLGAGLLCTVLDLAYIGLLLHAHGQPGTEPGRAVSPSPAEA